MDFKQIDGALTAFGYRGGLEDDPLGAFVEASLPLDDGSYFYFRPVDGGLLSCRECRRVSEKLAELNVAACNAPHKENAPETGGRVGG